jgi:hypothetical protein
MVSTGISEFTFGFGFLHEQINRLRQETLEDGTRLTGAPVFPSQQFEAERGYDVYLPTTGGDYYFQFKASEYFLDSRSGWIADGTHNGPYYQIKMHKPHYNNQHRVLRTLSRDKEHTYYVAPELNSLDQYKTAFLGSLITEASRKIPLKDCRDYYDGDQHFISFQPGVERWVEHSFSIPHDHSLLGKEIIRDYIKHKSEWKKIDDQYASNLFSDISRIAADIVTKKELDLLVEKFSTNLEISEKFMVDEKIHLSKKVKTLVKTSFILSHVFGATLFFVGSQGDSTT